MEDDEVGPELASAPVAPTCPYCGGVSRLVMGSDLFPSQPDLANKWYWRCQPCDAHVACHGDTQVTMGTPAKRELRQARASLHLQLDPMWQNASDLPLYAKMLASYPYKREEVTRKARERIYAYLAEKLGLDRMDCHIGKFDLDLCERASRILNAVDYQAIRLHSERRKQQNKILRRLEATEVDGAPREDGTD